LFTHAVTKPSRCSFSITSAAAAHVVAEGWNMPWVKTTGVARSRVPAAAGRIVSADRIEFDPAYALAHRTRGTARWHTTRVSTPAAAIMVSVA